MEQRIKARSSGKFRVRILLEKNLIIVSARNYPALGYPLHLGGELAIRQYRVDIYRLRGEVI